MPDKDAALAKVYAPAEVEAGWYAFWEKQRLFHAEPDPSRKPFTIVIPPPNITGVLHMGHILNNTLQDVYIRYKRMTGHAACWIPGTDHAGIATQNVVEKALRKEGLTRHDLGREKFLEKVWEWRKEYGGVIIRQLRTLGAACDWDREKFTMDETLSAAVREVFVRLYEEGLIYRGMYIVNWCPKDHTAISDDEVEYVEQQGSLYYIRYPAEGGGGLPPAVVATTRPETMLGDTAVAVHPEDERYRALVGKSLRLPLAGRSIPVVADSFVDPAFGTGMVKVTPAHDPNDYLIGQRHRLPQLTILDASARTNENVPERYRNLDRLEARARVLEDLEREGLLEKTEPHLHSVGRCYRCDTVIEPALSDQWFVRMQPLAEPARRAVAEGHVRFHPERWSRVYNHWMENLRDWCISRQLWWGHRIPVWYCDNTAAPGGPCPGPIVARMAPASCPRCGATRLRQDEDVLDTWFSSWLWPFSVHDWPAHRERGKAADLGYFYPTDLLVTGPDIIFFWVARMIMASLKFAPGFTHSDRIGDNVPFRDVYMTSIVRDEKGRKMSKSLGNSPEPMDLIAEYGADAVRFTILYLAPLGQDIHYAREKNELGRNFANKIWNAGRFLLMNRTGTGEEPPHTGFNLAHRDLADRWILSRFHSTHAEVTAAFNAFEINRVSRTVYGFFWHDYCDWYLEMIKSRLYGAEPLEAKRAVMTRALDIYDAALRLLHPLMPFVTEELWQHIRPRPEGDSILGSRLEEPDPSLSDPAVEAEMGFVQGVIESVRAVRGEMGIHPSAELKLRMAISGGRSEESILRYAGYLERLARVRDVGFLRTGDPPRPAATAVVEGEELFIPLEGLIDTAKERARLEKELRRLTGILDGVKTKLASDGFVSRAPAEVVAREREKLAGLETHREKVERNLAALL
ncbi:MAG: valine--tRNA ligase [Bacteroidota bacterium]